jgi:hypothetical protein
MRVIVTVIVRLFVDENTPDQICGVVQSTSPNAAPGKIPFQDAARLVEIFHSLSGRPDQTKTRSEGKE